MKLRHLVAIASVAVLAGCSRQPAEENASSGNIAGMEGHRGPMGEMPGHAQGPFAASERSMHRKMMAAVGVDAADTWVRKMIEHHQGAVDMSREVLALDPTPEVRAMAQTTIERQSKEMEELRGLVREGAPDEASARLYMAADAEMMRAMMAASGATPSESWARKMIEHHRGALAMSDIVLAQDPPPEIRRLAEQTKVDQGREIAELERMIAGGAG